jgi:hypothetical protein
MIDDCILFREKEVYSIDKRINFCYIEYIPVYYALIKFNYKFKGKNQDKSIRGDGKKEFSSYSKDIILSDIKTFINSKHNNFEIV